MEEIVPFWALVADLGGRRPESTFEQLCRSPLLSWSVLEEEEAWTAEPSFFSGKFNLLFSQIRPEDPCRRNE